MREISVRRRACLLLAALTAASPVLSQTNRAIRVLVPGPAGSGMDAYLRAVSPAVSAKIGNPLVIENLPGAGGTLATAQAARASNDGHTLLIVSSNHVINPSLYKSLPYDVINDFSPVTIVGTVPMVMVASPGLAARTIPELIVQMKAKPGEFNFGSLGVGTVLHLAGAAFNIEAGVSTNHVPYKDASSLIADLANGQIQIAYLALPSVAQLVKAGRIKAMGVTNAQRAPAMPDVPAIAEFVPGYAMDAWIALLAPKGMALAQSKKYFEAFKEAMSDSAAKEALSAQGMIPILMPPEKVRGFMQEELAKQTALAHRVGLTAQ
ncbi:tripartite tricarboxylate transporter substrate-binding protein [Xenophilus arseniciresistens]|uniref:Tripartite tricarboxylate transporter substrate-binding protein n=1 Tax=Xenophilus arseniciresistens TaxID=1283306 RepID=A0AAE3SY32_9BURK|nr:tripartite tricarboxylate transporter substrate-binding protein [Xenophilus arseniciresistens]MDA7415100.1 tripartite tricarboxylate transporter substrate-binding protein [Xenophilus arseniciresistens]